MSYNKLIKFKTRAKFNEQLKNIPNTSIVFIEDTGELWTHGKFYGGLNQTDGVYLPISGGTLIGSLTTRNVLIQNGYSLKMQGTAASAALITRGISGCDASATNLDELFLNYNSTRLVNINGGNGSTMISLGNGVIKIGSNIVYHPGNSNKLDVNWSCKDLTTSGPIQNIVGNYRSRLNQASGFTWITNTNIADGGQTNEGQIKLGKNTFLYDNNVVYHRGNSNNLSTTWSANKLNFNSWYSNSNNKIVKNLTLLFGRSVDLEFTHFIATKLYITGNYNNTGQEGTACYIIPSRYGGKSKPQLLYDSGNISNTLKVSKMYEKNGKFVITLTRTQSWNPDKPNYGDNYSISIEQSSGDGNYADVNVNNFKITDPYVPNIAEDYYYKEIFYSSINFNPDLKANLVSPSFTGTPTAPTAAPKTNTTQIATTAFVRKEVSDLVGGAPETLDTLKEIADYLTNGSIAGGIVDQLGKKVNKSGDTLTGRLLFNECDGIAIASNNKDLSLLKVWSSDQGEGKFGFDIKYIGTGAGNDNSLRFICDNQSGTKVNALDIKQNGNIIAGASINAIGGLQVNGQNVWHSGNLTGNQTGHVHNQYYDSNLNRTKNTILAAPNGSDGKATFRTLVAADIPTLNQNTSGYASSLKVIPCRTGTNEKAWNTIKVNSSSTKEKLNVYDSYNEGGPSTYGNILEIVGISQHWQPQLWFDAYKTGKIRFRNKDYNNDSWGNWRTLAFSDEVLQLTGGTLSGRLYINQSSGNPGVQFNVSGTNKGVVGYHPSIGGIFLYNTTANKHLFFKDDGKLYIENTEISVNGHTHNLLSGNNYISGGNEKPNYFGSGKLKYQMLSGSNLGNGSTAWYDCLWISSYTGGDVKSSTLISISKGDPANMFVSTQNYDSTSWGTQYRIWNSKNSGTTAYNWSAKALTLAGGISGVTTISSTSQIELNTSNNINFVAGGKGIIFNTSSAFKPHDVNSNQLTLGTGSARWSTIYGTNLNLNGAITGATTIDATSIIKSTVSGKSIEMVGNASYGKIQVRGGVPLSLNPEGNNVAINTTAAAINLAIGDSDTGFKWNSDGNISGYANNVSVFSWTSGGVTFSKPITVGGLISGSTSLRLNTKNYHNVANRTTTTGTETGIIKIKLPYKGTNSMNTYEIDIYQYNSRGHSKIYVSGYNYSNGWVNTSATILGTLANNKIRLANDGTYDCILIGEVNTSWSYPQIYLSKVTQGYGNTADWSSGYEISFITVETGLAGIVTPTVNANMPFNNYVHPTFTARSAGGTRHFITGFASNGEGHVTSITTAAMTKADIEALLTGTVTTHTHTFSSLTGHIVAGNEFNFVPSGYNNAVHFNYKANGQSACTVTEYHFRNGNTGFANINALGFKKNGSSDSYVLLGGGGHKAISDFFSYKESAITIGGDGNTFYCVAIGMYGSLSTNLHIYKHVHNPTDWDGWFYSEFRLKCREWGGNIEIFECLYNNYSTKNFIAKTATTSNNGTYALIWLRGGNRTYHFRNVGSTHTPTVYLNGGNLENTDLSPVTSGNIPVVTHYWTNGNFNPDNKLNLSGGKMSGCIESTSNDPALRVLSGTTSKAAYGWLANQGAYLYNYNSGKYLGIKEDGTPHYHGNTLWHNGNFDPSSFIRTQGTINNNIDNDYGEGFVTFDPVPSGTPPLSSPNIRTINVGTYGRRTQMAFNYATDQVFFRRKLDSQWHAWKEFYHTGNLNVNSFISSGTKNSVTNWHVNGYCNGSPNSPLFYFSHSGGYGMHINTRNTSNDIYAFQLNNGSTSHFTVFNSGRVEANYISCGYNSGQANSFGCSNWFRSSGATGWYNATYNGGIYMTDTTWVRTSHDKKFYCNNTGNDAINSAGGVWAGTGFFKSGSSNDYILLGGGGHKAVSDFNTAHRLHITDNRGADRAPNYYTTHALSTFFNETIPNSFGTWASGITVKGWGDGYRSWQLFGYSSTGSSDELFFRSAVSDTAWQTPRKIWHSGNLSLESVQFTRGMIMMWSGAHTAVPAGWLLCNGANGTPDLRDKFVMGAGNVGVGSTGGTNSNMLTPDNVPEHRHRPEGGNGTEDVENQRAFLTNMRLNWSDNWPYTNGGGGDSNRQCIRRDWNGHVAFTGKRIYTEAIVSGGVQIVKVTQKAVENRPAYYALAFIMKS